MPTATIDPANLGDTDLEALPIGVLRWHQPGGPSDPGWFEPLPHVVFEECTYYEGPRPPDCVLRYVMDPTLFGVVGFEQLLPFGSPSPLALQHDDRIVVIVQAVDGGYQYLFDGFVEMPGLQLDQSRADVPIRCVGVAKRLWDTPIGDAFARLPYLVGGGDPLPAQTRLPVRWNPDGRPNCAVEAPIATANGYEFYCFADPYAGESGAIGDWSLDRAIGYLLGVGNTDEDYVRNPPREELERMLRAIVVDDNYTEIDPYDPATYDLLEVAPPDRVMTDLPLPEAMAATLAGRGYAFKFGLTTGADGYPYNFLLCYPTRDLLPQADRLLLLQPEGASLDTARSNLAEADLQRDGTGLVTAYRARLAPLAVEACFLLLPAWEPVEADGDDDGAAWVKTASGAEPSHKYRVWRLAESGLQWYDAAGEVFHPSGPDSVTSLADFLPVEAPWSVRSRPPLPSRPPTESLPGLLSRTLDRPSNRLGILVSEGEPGDEAEAGCDISLLARPGVLNEAAVALVTWVKGGWRLADDECAVVLEVDDPNDWDLGKEARAVPGLNGGRARLVDWMTGTNGSSRRAVGLVLLAAIESDATGADVAGPPDEPDPVGLTVDLTAFAPGRHRIERVVDLSDRYRVELRHRACPDFDGDAHPYTPPEGPTYQVASDGRPEAIAEIRQLADSASFAPFRGGVTIPRLTDIYGVGARILAVDGRGLDLIGVEGSGRAAYPRVVAMTWRAGRAQETVLQLNDMRAQA